MVGVLLAFASSIFWGASDFVGGVSARASTALRATVWSFVGATAATAVALVFSPGTASSAAFSAGLLAAIFAVAGFLTLYASLAAAPMGVVTVIVGAAEAVVPVLVGVVWHREGLSVLAWVGIAVALVGVSLIGLAEGGRVEASWQPLVLALVSGLLFGASLVALDAAPEDSGFLTPAAEVLAGLLFLLVIAWTVRRFAGMRRLGDQIGVTTGPDGPTASGRWWGLLAGVFLAIANITLLLALRAGQLAVVGVVLCLYPVTTAVLARVFLHERLTAKHIVGIAVALSGCVLLAAG
jgi:drug/metabolite transporter (DMT)-like permease